MKVRTHRSDGRKPRRVWQKTWSDSASGKFAVWELLDSDGFRVCHCLHSTALWPWYGETPDGSMILAPNGRAFQFLNDAKVAVEIAAEWRRR